jgi:hypothetical protein
VAPTTPDVDKLAGGAIDPVTMLMARELARTAHEIAHFNSSAWARGNAGALLRQVDASMLRRLAAVRNLILREDAFRRRP